MSAFWRYIAIYYCVYFFFLKVPRGRYILENLLFSALVVIYVVCVRRREERGILKIPKKKIIKPQKSIIFLFSTICFPSMFYPVLTAIYIQF